MNDAIGAGGLSRADRDREVVQRTAELLTSSLSLEELFHAVCSLLERFVDASTVFIALRDGDAARIAFLLENGEAARLENRIARAGTNTDTVLRTGRSLLKRRFEDWSEGRVALNLPGRPEKDDRVSAIFVPLKFGAEVIGVLSVQSDRPDAYDEEDVELLQTCALYLSVRVHQAQLETQSARLENIASTDSLTGIPNRRSFNQRFAAEWRRGIRRGVGIAAIVIDIDFFKAFNDTYGHVAGDAALQQVATALSSCLSRSEDFFARYGGEEFVAILSDTTLEGASKIAERMRQSVFDLGIAHSGSALQRLTISAGAAWKIPAVATHAESLLEAADAALYQAKRTGRNRVAAENYVSDTPPAYAAKAYKHNLPEIRGTTFGRTQHLRQLRKLLRSSRLLSIVGPAGVGKSREALETAQREMIRFPDGIYYLDCSAIIDPRYLPAKLAVALNVLDSPLVPAVDTFVEFLKSKKALLVLDNCDPAKSSCATLIPALVNQTRGLRILVTIREPLMLAGETAYVLPPLEPAHAAALFADSARASSEGHALDDALVERICEQLGGVPRAIQLAAAQTGTFELSQLAQQLRKRDTAGREAVRDFVEWTYELLSPAEQDLLRKLAVFNGGATADAVRFVCGSSASLSALVEKALVSVDRSTSPERFALPATTRAFALARVNERAEWNELSLAHARYFCERAKQLDASYSTKEWQPSLYAMVRELDNLRAALFFTVSEEHDLQLGAELSSYLVGFWNQIGRGAWGRDWIERLLSRTDVRFPGPVRAQLQYGLAHLDATRSKRSLDAALLAVQMYRELGDRRGLSGALFEVAAAYSGLVDIDAGAPYLAEALEIATSIGDLRHMADALNGMAIAEQWRGNPDRARELLERSLALFRQLEDDRGVASLLGNLGDLAAGVGDYDRAVRLSRQSLAILERLHDPQSAGWQLLNLGAFELKRGNVDAARPALHRALELVREHQDDWLSANCVDSLARLALAEQKWESALRLAAFADEIFAQIGVPRQPPDQLEYQRLVQQAKAALGKDVARRAMEGGRAMTWELALQECP